MEILDILHREFVYIRYYFMVLLDQIAPYWILGMVLGFVISIFVKDRINGMFRALGNKRLGVLGIISASALGIASPLCMCGTIPFAASFSRSGMRDDWLVAFMMSSILLNPQLIIYSTALGTLALVIRIVSCFLCGIAAGLLIWFIYKDKNYFNFDGFEEQKTMDTDSNLFILLVKNIGRNIKATALWFLLGVLMAATIGIPLYACGGGTVPLLQQWLYSGMSMGSAAAFMITRSATKITNLGALKIVLGQKKEKQIEHETATVYFTTDISSNGMLTVYHALGFGPEGKLYT